MDETRIQKTMEKENTLFKFSFSAKIQITPPIPNSPIIKLETENPIPQYMVNVNISTYSLSISQQQLQSLLRFAENMQLYNNKVALLKDRGSLKPQYSITEVLYALDDDIGLGKGAHRILQQKVKDFLNTHEAKQISVQKYENLQSKKKIIVNRWWKYAIFSVIKKNKEDQKDKKKDKLLGIMEGDGLNKMFEFRLPSILKDVYQSEMDKIVHGIVFDKLKDENLKEKVADIPEAHNVLKDIGDSIIDLRSMLFTIAEQERKSMTRKSITKIVDKEKLRKENTWGQWAKGYLPFIFEKTQHQKNLDEMKSMIEDQIGNKKEAQKFNKNLLSLNMNINQALITFLGGTKNQTIEFQYKLNGLKLQFNSCGKTIDANLKFKSFVFSYIKSFYSPSNGQTEKVQFDILKSTTQESGDFLQLDYLQTNSEHQSDTNISIAVEHMDFFFVKNVFRDLQGFFTIQADKEMRDQAWQEISRLSKKRQKL